MWGIVAFLAVLAAVVGITALWQRDMSRRPRSGTGGAGAFGPIDEVFAPTRHESMAELGAQYDRTAPAPIPGDPRWLDVDLGDDDRPGTVTIRG
jgi:hypothetical protein